METLKSEPMLKSLNARRKIQVERALKDRFYLLQQSGPNTFIVGTDDPKQKYRINIGPQTCSCFRHNQCPHIFFVMLRFVDFIHPFFSNLLIVF